MRTIAFSFLVAILAPFADARTDGFFTSAVESRYVFGLDGTRCEVLDGEVVAARPVAVMMDFPDGAAIAADGITPTANFTNINGVAHTRVLVDFSCNFDWKGWHPFIQHVTFGGVRSRLELQDDCVYLGTDSREGVSNYTHGWHGYVVGYAPSDLSGFYSVSVEPEPYDGDAQDTVVVTPSGEKVDAARRYVMVDQKGNVDPPGVLATREQAESNEVRIAADEASASALSNETARAVSAIDDLAASIIGNEVVVYEDDFIYSLGDAVAISTNCLCRIYDFRAKQATVTVDGVACDRSWVYFGFTENIGSLNPVAQFRDSLSSEIDWGEVTCGTPEAQEHEFTVGGDTFAYCYRMSVDIPKTYSAAFIRVFTEITAQVGDGSVLDVVGGLSGGLTGTVTLSGGGQVEFRGGLAVEPIGTQEGGE